LSFTNEPDKLVNMALDTLSQTMNLKCCWIQTITDWKNQPLSLAAERGFSDEMRLEILSMDRNQSFSGQIIGMGQKIVIQNLNNDGLYGLSSFRNAGYKCVVAVPLMTYRVYGILGIASHKKNFLREETTDLLMVIGSLIASALSKAQLTRNFPPRQKPANSPVLEPPKETPRPDMKTGTDTNTTSSGPPPDDQAKQTDTPLNSHFRKMESFRRSHR
jgi:signal transduction protein with GAF and PtsI domain